MDIIDDIASAGENAVEFALKQVNNIKEQIGSLLKALDLIKKAENKFSDVQNEANITKKDVEKLCNDIYVSNGSNIAKSFVNYADNLMRDNNNMVTTTINSVLNSFDVTKNKIALAIKNAEKSINNIMAAIGSFKLHLLEEQLWLKM